MYSLIRPLEKILDRSPRLWGLLNRQGTKPEELPVVDAAIANHVVIVGFVRVGKHIATLLGDMHIPYLIVHRDPEQVDELEQRRIPNLYGDAANSEVITHADLKHARALVVVGPDQSASEMIVAAARDLAPSLPIIARASSPDGIKRLVHLGAQYVIHPELEAGLEIVRHTLLQLGFPMHEITRYTDSVRQDRYDLLVNTEEEHRLLRNLIDAVDGIEVTWRLLPAGNPLIGQTLAEANLRARTGASVVAIYRGKLLMANSKSMTVFEPGDRIGFIGDSEQIEAVEELLVLPD